ncbi:hypothetical protein Pfo_020314, partial [Paulownia fortunei]
MVSRSFTKSAVDIVEEHKINGFNDCGSPSSSSFANPSQYVNWFGVHLAEDMYKSMADCQPPVCYLLSKNQKIRTRRESSYPASWWGTEQPRFFFAFFLSSIATSHLRSQLLYI